MVPLRNVVFKVSDELVRRLECVGALFPVEVSVVALSDLVVVAHRTHSVDDVSQPILELVRRTDYFNAPQRVKRAG